MSCSESMETSNSLLRGISKGVLCIDPEQRWASWISIEPHPRQRDPKPPKAWLSIYQSSVSAPGTASCSFWPPLRLVPTQVRALTCPSLEPMTPTRLRPLPATSKSRSRSSRVGEKGWLQAVYFMLLRLPCSEASIWSATTDLDFVLGCGLPPIGAISLASFQKARRAFRSAVRSGRTITY